MIKGSLRLEICNFGRKFLKSKTAQNDVLWFNRENINVKHATPKNQSPPKHVI